jgi:hypothetical protein
MPLNATIALSITGALTASLDLEAVTSSLTKKLLMSLSDGSGANQATNVFSDTRTLAASASESLDLAGTLINALGATISFAKVRALMVFAAASNINDVLVGGVASNGFIAPFGSATDKVKVKPGGAMILLAPDVNGYAVTAATADLLQIANSAAGTTVTYDVIVIGS